MDKSKLNELRKEFRRLQGSVNYWKNAARAARRDADRHVGERQALDLARLADCEKKAVQASQQLDGIKAQLTELDPKGARARQLNALRSAIGRAKREILHFAHLAKISNDASYRQLCETRLARRQTKLAQLEQALLEQHRELAKLADDQEQKRQYLAKHIAIASAPFAYDPNDPANFEEARFPQPDRCRVTATDLPELDRHTPSKPRRPMH